MVRVRLDRHHRHKVNGLVLRRLLRPKLDSGHVQDAIPRERVNHRAAGYVLGHKDALRPADTVALQMAAVGAHGHARIKNETVVFVVQIDPAWHGGEIAGEQAIPVVGGVWELALGAIEDIAERQAVAVLTPVSTLPDGLQSPCLGAWVSQKESLRARLRRIRCLWHWWYGLIAGNLGLRKERGGGKGEETRASGRRMRKERRKEKKRKQGKVEMQIFLASRNTRRKGQRRSCRSAAWCRSLKT